MTTFDIAYNAKKKQTTKNCIIKIVSINIDRAKIADIIFNSFCFDIVKFQTNSLTSKTLNSSRQNIVVKIKTTVLYIVFKDSRIKISNNSNKLLL